METLEEPAVFFAMVLALSLLTERFIETVKIFFDYLDFIFGWDRYWSKRADRLHQKLKKILSHIMRSKPELQERVIKRYQNRTLNKSGSYTGSIVVISGDMMRVIFIRVAAKFIGICFGIWLAYQFKVDLFSYVSQTADVANAAVRIFLSGIIIGLGSGPVHKVITTIERARKKQKQKASK